MFVRHMLFVMFSPSSPSSLCIGKLSEWFASAPIFKYQPLQVHTVTEQVKHENKNKPGILIILYQQPGKMWKHQETPGNHHKSPRNHHQSPSITINHHKWFNMYSSDVCFGSVRWIQLFNSRRRIDTWCVHGTSVYPEDLRCCLFTGGKKCRQEIIRIFDISFDDFCLWVVSLFQRHFGRGWFIDFEVCNQIVNLRLKNKHAQQVKRCCTDA